MVTLNNKLIYTYENVTKYIDHIVKNQLFLISYINIYNKNKTLNKSKVLKIKNKFNLSYLCKNDICVKVEYISMPKFVEIPDGKGNIKRYISKSYTYRDLKLHNYDTIKSVEPNIYLSYKCTSDSQCLTNKCIDGVCIFNEENPTEFCTSIYINLFIRFSYMHCGKMIGDICKKDKECGSKNCLSQKNICGNPPDGPSDSDITDGLINLICLVIIIFIIYKILCRCIKSIIKNKIKKE